MSRNNEKLFRPLPRPHPRRVLVIGGGPCGLVALRNLVERGEFERVELVERRDDIGGVWYLDEHNSPSDPSHPRWPSPAYPGMVGNVLPDFLYFSEHPFPKPDRPTQPFPTLSETYDYLKRFAEPYLADGRIRLNIEVVRVQELQDSKGWKVAMKDWGSGVEFEEKWDAVVIAVGWFDNPVWPETSGLEELQKEGLASHAKSWRGPQGFEGKRVLVVGNAYSANDIAAQLVSVAQLPVYRSVRRSPFPGFPSLPDDRIQNVAPVKQLNVMTMPGDKKTVAAALKDGTQLEDIDFVFFGTGYRPYPSFIHVLDEASGALKPLLSAAIQPQRIPSVHRHILYAPNPTLGFVGAPMAFTPFIVADVSSTWLSLAWSGQIEYPDTIDGRLAFERERLAKIADSANFFLSNEGTDKIGEEMRNLCVNGELTSFISYNVLSIDEESYAQGLRDDITAVRPALGGVLPEWTKERYEQRNAMYQIKLEALKTERAKKYI